MSKNNYWGWGLAVWPLQDFELNTESMPKDVKSLMASKPSELGFVDSYWYSPMEVPVPIFSVGAWQRELLAFARVPTKKLIAVARCTARCCVGRKPSHRWNGNPRPQPQVFSKLVFLV